MAERGLYGVLGVERGASPLDIEAAYGDLVLDLCPGIHRVEKGAGQEFLEIVKAYRVLGDPERRKAYDEEGFAGVKLEWVDLSNDPQLLRDPQLRRILRPGFLARLGHLVFG